MDLKTDQIVWSSAEYKLKFILDNPNFGLPQIVRVVQGYMIDEDESLASGQILTLHGQKKVENLNGRDKHGKEVNIPISCPFKVKVVSISSKRYFQNIRDICKCEVKPRFFVNRDVLATGNGKCFPVGTKLQFVDTLKSVELEDVGIICQTVPAGRETLHLPLDFAAQFEECLPADVEVKRYFLWEAVKEFGLPIEVQFPPVTDRSSGYGPQLGSLHLEKMCSADVVMATSILDGIRYAITFSADLPVTIQVAKGMLDNLQTYEETRQRQQQTVDLKRFDYLSNADPFAPGLFHNEVYDALKTPSLPRKPKAANPPAAPAVCPPPRPAKPALARGKSEDSPRMPSMVKDMKDLELFVKEKLKFKSFRKDKKTSSSLSPNCNVSLDGSLSYRTFIASDDGNSSTGACSIDITSTGSGGAESFQQLADCMDAVSLDHTVVDHRSRKSSADSGVCLPVRNSNSSGRRQRSHSRRLHEQEHTEFVSGWSLPAQVGEQRSLGKTPSIAGSVSYLWGVMDGVSSSDLNNNANNKSRSAFASNGLGDKDSVSDYSPRENFDTSYSSRSDTSSQNEAEIPRSPEEARMQNSMNELRLLTEEGVVELLTHLKMSEFAGLFRDNQINGELLISLDVRDFIADLKLSVFQAKKLFKYIRGWRPRNGEENMADRASRRNSLNPRDWTEDDVLAHMTSINLPDFGKFCQHHQVNGELLLEILDNDALQALRIEHHVKISSLETKKLTNFVVKGWRPDSSPKKSVPRKSSRETEVCIS